MQDNLTTYDIYKYVSTQSSVYKKAFYTALGRKEKDNINLLTIDKL